MTDTRSFFLLINHFHTVLARFLNSRSTWHRENKILLINEENRTLNPGNKRIFNEKRYFHDRRVVVENWSVTMNHYHNSESVWNRSPTFTRMFDPTTCIYLCISTDLIGELVHKFLLRSADLRIWLSSSVEKPSIRTGNDFYEIELVSYNPFDESIITDLFDRSSFFIERECVIRDIDLQFFTSISSNWAFIRCLEMVKACSRHSIFL